MELWLALIALWLWECLAFLPLDGLGFSLPRAGRTRVQRRSGLHLSGAWPLRFGIALDGLPFEGTPSSVIAAGPLSLFAATGASREERAHPWQDAGPEAVGAIIRTRAGKLLRASSDVSAERIAAALRELAAAAPEARAGRALEMLRAAFGAKDVGARIAGVRRATLPHRVIASFSLVGVALGVPALAIATPYAWDSIWENTWPVWLALHGLGFTALAVAELRLQAPGRGGRLFRAAIYPPAQWRGSHELASGALASLHPIVALCALLDADELEPWARRALSECDHPRFDLPHLATGPEAEARRAALRARRAELSALFVRAGVALARLEAPPLRRDASAGSYCPRCFEEFVASGWVCTECRLETRAYGAPAS